VCYYVKTFTFIPISLDVSVLQLFPRCIGSGRVRTQIPFIHSFMHSFIHLQLFKAKTVMHVLKACVGVAIELDPILTVLLGRAE